jgi:hypothetical protein
MVGSSGRWEDLRCLSLALWLNTDPESSEKKESALVWRVSVWVGRERSAGKGGSKVEGSSRSSLRGTLSYCVIGVDAECMRICEVAVGEVEVEDKTKEQDVVGCLEAVLKKPAD